MKAILVIDNMPNCCVACPFSEFINGDDPDDCRTYCIAKLGLINEYATEVRPNWCPLKPMPNDYPPYEKTRNQNFYTEEEFDAYEKGWNDCLEEIEKC